MFLNYYKNPKVITVIKVKTKAVELARTSMTVPESIFLQLEDPMTLWSLIHILMKNLKETTEKLNN